MLKCRHHFADKGPCTQGYDLSSSHVRMWDLDNKEGRALKNWCFRAVVLEKIFESPLENKDIKPVNLKGNQPGIFFERTDAEAEAPVLWPLDLYSWLIGKDHDARKDWRQKEKRVIEDDGMVAWHHGFTGHELGQTLGDDEEQGSLACCSHEMLNMIWWLNDNNSMAFRQCVCPSVTEGNWVQDSQGYTKMCRCSSPYIKWHSIDICV